MTRMMRTIGMGSGSGPRTLLVAGNGNEGSADGYRCSRLSSVLPLATGIPLR